MMWLIKIPKVKELIIVWLLGRLIKLLDKHIDRAGEKFSSWLNDKKKIAEDKAKARIEKIKQLDKEIEEIARRKASL